MMDDRICDDRICDDCICQVCDIFGDYGECLHGNPCNECNGKVATAYCPWYLEKRMADDGI